MERNGLRSSPGKKLRTSPVVLQQIISSRSSSSVMPPIAGPATARDGLVGSLSAYYGLLPYCKTMRWWLAAGGIRQRRPGTRCRTPGAVALGT
ncbi:hypothetical protein HU200_027057 [Digitaria exilis]|uniref:Uncharacterized protein n=1 Tax=Digitaria exilis TaxID=1010633 RepID=A0A835ER69_9POAL|nr:hypothetical protein HU200_027057 [Digitaria exilis]